MITKEKIEAILDAIKSLSTSRYTCTRVRDAWQYNTMSQEDFIELWEDDDYFEDVKNILEKEL